MKNRWLRSLSPLLIAATTMISGCSTADTKDVASKKSSPNVLFVLVDDMGWEDLSFMGSSYYKSPNLDKLAAEGMVFSDAYSNSPNCAPTRAALMSGQYAPATKVYTVAPKDRGKAKQRALLTPENNEDLAPSFVTLAEQFQQAGFATGFFGKWHLGQGTGDTSPTNQGFDINVGGFNKGHPKSYFSPYKNPMLSDGPKGEYLTDRLTTEAIGFISEQVKADKPFFAYLSYYSPHTPLQAKPELIGQYEAVPKSQRQGDPRYAAMVETIDTNIGRLIATLKTQNVLDNTLIVFTSDNGGSSRATTMPSLKGAKGMLYEGGVRVPLFFHWPQYIPAGETDIPAMSMDFYPTLLSLSGIRPVNSVQHGTDLSPVLQGKTAPKTLAERALFWHFPFYLERGRRNLDNPNNIATPSGWRAEPGGSVRLGDYKLIEYFETGALELYNLREDLKEQHNIAAAQPKKVAELKQLMLEWRQQYGADMPLGPNPKFVANPSSK